MANEWFFSLFRVKMGATTVPHWIALPRAQRKARARGRATGWPTLSLTYPPGTCASCWVFRYERAAGNGWGWMEFYQVFSQLMGTKSVFGSAFSSDASGAVGLVSLGSSHHCLSTDCYPPACSNTLPLDVQIVRQRPRAGANQLITTGQILLLKSAKYL